ncbi:LysM peptidoglycan-binding domain-containing protein [Halochromatium sp.]
MRLIIRQRSHRGRVCYVALTGLLSLFAWPQLLVAQVALQPDAPEVYTVRPGDTLWGIAGRFLRDPWRWPEVWEGNPEIGDPSQIYPGEQLVLDISDAGAPRVRAASDGLRVVKLSPRVRVTALDAAIPTIPIGAIAPFLSRPWVTDSRVLDDAPYVVGFPREHLLAGTGDRIFVRRIMTATDTGFEVLRPGPALRDPKTHGLLGYEAIYVAQAELERTGDPATLRVTRSTMQVQMGDRVRPARDETAIRSFLPRPAPPGLEGHIISVLDGVSQIGQYDVVVLDRGSREGVEVGQVFAAYRGGTEVRDQVISDRKAWNWRNESPLYSSFWLGEWEITGWERDRPDPNAPLPLHRRAERLSDRYIVPDSRTGILMVFRVFPRVSFALVMRANQAMHVGETVATPDGG